MAKDTVEKINNKAGAIVLMRASDMAKMYKRSVVSSGMLTLDYAMAIGGLPIPDGKIIQIYGDEHSGKSTIAMLTIAELHKKDPTATVCYVDIEHSLGTEEDLKYPERLGVDMDRLLILPATDADKAMEVIEPLIVSDPDMKLVVVDSIARVNSVSQLERDFRDGMQMGSQAKTVHLMITKLMRAINSDMSNRKGVMLLNQTRANLAAYGAPVAPACASALKFDCSVTIELRKHVGEKVNVSTEGEVSYASGKKSGDVVGYNVVGVIKKSKVSTSSLTEENFNYRLIAGKGIDKVYDIMMSGLQTSVFSQTSAYYYYKDQRFHGANEFGRWIETLPAEELELLVSEIRKGCVRE